MATGDAKTRGGDGEELGERFEDGIVGFAFFGSSSDFDDVFRITDFGDFARPLAGFDVKGKFHFLLHHVFINGRERVERRYPIAGTRALRKGLVSSMRTSQTLAMT